MDGAGQPGGGEGVLETLAQPRLSTPSPYSNGGAHKEWALDLLPLPTLLPSALSPSWVRSRDRALLAGAVGRRVEGQGPGPRSQPCGLAWKGPGFAELGQRSREAGAPSQQAFMRHPVARRPSPRSHALILPLTLPPKSAPHSGRTQESHQLPPLSRGPAAPRASLDGSLAAVSSSSSSSSSPSVNSSWPGP